MHIGLCLSSSSSQHPVISCGSLSFHRLIVYIYGVLFFRPVFRPLLCCYFLCKFVFHVSLICYTDGLVNPRIVLLDCNLEYKKGESQVRCVGCAFWRCACICLFVCVCVWARDVLCPISKAADHLLVTLQFFHVVLPVC